MAAAGRARGGQNHAFITNTANNKQAQLTNAYQELGKELGSEKLKVVGGYTLGRVIGEGSYGSVHLATHRLTGTRCAVKKIPKSATTHLTREIHHHRQLHHPHIVHLHEIVATENHVWLVSELCSGGELFDYLVERGRILEGEARRLFGELTLAVACMHMRGVVHRDLKLENVLLDGEMRIKLGDLGFAREYQRGRLMETFCGTTGYASPEMLSGRKYLGEETDIWSLGIILYTLLCGGLPFDNDDDHAMKELILIGEYEEPEWLSQEARSLIRGMLQSDSAKRLSITSILAHPWFKKTIIDDIHSLVLNAPSLPPSPNCGSASNQDKASVFSEPWRTTPNSRYLSPHASGPSPLTSPPVDVALRPQTDSEPSDTSVDFFDSDLGLTSSGVTTPTTGEDEDQHALSVEREHSGEFSHTEKVLELLHSNGSQSTIRDGDASVAVRNRIAVKGSLEGQQELDEEAVDDRPLVDALLPVPQHSRTPSRTKRQSIPSALSIERKHSYNASSSQSQTFFPKDYLSTLNTEVPVLFSTASEKALLHQLSEIGVDTGQLTHSVSTDACDTSAATWWFLRQRQRERGETDEVVEARVAATTRRRERAAAYQREERKKARTTENSRAVSPEARMADVKFKEETTTIPAISDFASLGAPVMTPARPVVGPSEMIPVVATTSSLEISSKSAAILRTRGRPDPIYPALHPQTPPRDSVKPSREGSPARVKTRSPSITMLQRATSAFALGGKKPEDALTMGTPDTQPSVSPTKLTKPPPRPRPDRSESDMGILSTARPSPEVPLPSQEGGPSTFPGSMEISQASARETASPATIVHLGDAAAKLKIAKRDSVWTTLRYLFNEDKRRRKRDSNVPVPEIKSLPPAVVLSRGIAARTPHMTRTNQPTPSSRRASIDGGRPVYSRRSSSIKSRRSSYGSVFVTEVPDPLILRRRSSQKTAGSATPTSENDYPSRPSSSHSMHPNRRSINSLASPILSADPSGKFRPSVPSSPLHDYHRRPPGGTASRRVQHGRFLPASQILRHGSVSSGPRSAASSRASSIDKGKDLEVPLDSDYDSARDDSVFHSRRQGPADRRSSNVVSAQQISNTRSLSMQTSRTKPIRDVFKQKDDEWVSDDEREPSDYAGGLGQNRSKFHGPQADRWRSRASTHPNVASANKRSTASGRRHRQSVDIRRNNDEDDDVLKGKDTLGADVGRRRGGLPETRIAQPPPIEEEEEDE